ncbi:MAG: tetratricopeptide repeat protein, partial [Cyclobacteriaceae bacterium]|nr:tetratricopeptide repeat protein [Cyclobacteriaceae bacterium]
FKVQSDIAKIIANELNAGITPEEEQKIETDPTNDLTAYDFYLKGNEYKQRSSHKEDLRIAIQMYEKAIEIDSNYVLAWVGMASSNREIYWFYYDRTKEQLIRTKEYLDYAISLSPNQKEVQLEEGSYYYHCKRDYPKALQIFEKLRSKFPNDDELNFMIGAVYRRMGDFKKSLEYFKMAISLNPSDWRFWNDTGNTLRILGKYNDAEKYIKTAIDLNPSNHRLYSGLLWAHVLKGQIKKAKEIIQNNPRVIDHPNTKFTQAYIEILDRKYEKAIQIINSLSEEAVSYQLNYRTKHLELGLIYHMMGNNELSVRHFESEKVFLLGKLDTLQNDSRLYRSLGIAYAGLGMKKEAIEAGERALDILNFSNDAYAGYAYEMGMVKILVIVGEYKDALTRLDNIISRHGGISVEVLKLDPFWNPIRDMDGFKAIINNPEYQVNLTNN